MKQDDCPNKSNHTPRPYGYLAYHEWALQMEKTHQQERCPDCGLWAIWTPRQPQAAQQDGAQQ